MRYSVGLGLVLTAAAFLGACTSSSKAPVPKEQWRAYANELYNRQLFPQAIEAYREYLRLYPVSAAEHANITFTIGEIYFDRLHDYENALAEYVKIKRLFPQTEVVREAETRIVECLDRLQRPADARQALWESTGLDTSQVPQHRPGVVVARIGNREITQGDLDFELNRLPPSLRERIRTREDKLRFLREYVATEILYRDAARQGLDRDRDVMEGAVQAKKQLMVQKLIEREIADKIRPARISSNFTTGPTATATQKRTNTVR
ncbi:MAG: hypothetical protein ONB23_02170 [candidate division KSB1 bacterium]|nr:hypothetical protein [candidate division KSB1 bacterium]